MPNPRHVDFAFTAAVLDALPDLVAARMDVLGVSYRETGRQAGISFSSVYRFVEGGHDPSFRVAKCLLRWLHLTTPALSGLDPQVSTPARVRSPDGAT